MKQSRHNSERSRSGTSAWSVTGGSSPPSASEVQHKHTEEEINKKNTSGNSRKPRSEDRSEREQCKRNRNRDDPSEHETTDDEMNIQEKQNQENQMCK